MVRSLPRVVMITLNPPSTSPTRWASGTRTSVRNTSLNPAAPVIWRSGRTSTPGACMSTFLVDMHAPGVDVRPLRQMTGAAGFNEVFLTDVRVPDAHRVGDVDGGFSVIITTLGNERTIPLRSGGASRGPTSFERVLAVAEHYADRSDPMIRQQLASIYTYEKLEEYMMARMAAHLEGGGTPGAEMMILKLASTRHSRALVSFLTNALGPRLIADSGEWGAYSWSNYVVAAPGGGIGGGTNEIVRNRLGETVLGLPREPRVQPGPSVAGRSG